MSTRLKRDPAVRNLSAFYTPATLADVLAQWMVRDGAERILEPSVGGGSLVSAAIRQAEFLRGTSAVRFTVCDVNAAAVEALSSRLGPASEARSIDFLQLDPASTGKFDGVLANPPFTRNHSIDPRRREVLRQRFETTGAAGLWVHFLIHAMDFLRNGGRLASVIPASALFSDYGRDALQRISGKFADVEIREMVDRPLWENGADERGALLLADGFELGSSVLPAPSQWSASGRPELYPARSMKAYERLIGLSTPLGDLAKISIGAVTGHNKVFLIDEQQRTTLGIAKSELTPIVSRARHVPGLSVDSARLFALAQQGEKTWLLSPSSLATRGSGVRRQLARISAQRRRSTVWFSKRTPWWKVDVGAPSDAIFTYMNDRGPRLVLTASNLRCTNTLHYVRFSKTHRASRYAAAMSVISSFGQLAAEHLGRSYGGGVLKFELKDVRHFPILPSEANLKRTFEQCDNALQEGRSADATEIADQALLAPLVGKDWRAAVQLFRTEIAICRVRRRGDSR